MATLRGGVRTFASISTTAPNALSIDAGQGAQVNLCAHILRAECQCSECRHKETNQRIVDVSSVRDVTITEASISDSALSVSFSDGHEAEFSLQWVASMARAQASKAGISHAPSVTPRSPELLIPEQMELWDAGRAAGGPGYMPFSDAVAGGSRTLGVLETLNRDGVVVLEDSGTEDEALWQLVESLGYPQRTHYGDTFHVLSKAVPDSLANTGHALTYHTDLAYRGEPPAFQILHCQQNDANGGASIVADGFQAAVDLLRDDPETFELLSTRLLDFTWQGRDGVMLRGRQPSLKLAHDGTLEAIHLDSRNMSMAYAVAESSSEEQQKLLGMVCKLFDYVNRPEYTLRYMLRPGDMVVFDNRRMLHGRDAFDIETGARRLHGCYMERDMIASTHRAIEEQVNASMLFQAQPEFARSTDWDRMRVQATA